MSNSRPKPSAMYLSMAVVCCGISLCCAAVSADQQRVKLKTVPELCNVAADEVVEIEQAICIAKLSGMNEGYCGLMVDESYPMYVGDELAWPVRNVLEGVPDCSGLGPGGTFGEIWYISFSTGEILKKSTWSGGVIG